MSTKWIILLSLGLATLTACNKSSSTEGQPASDGTQLSDESLDKAPIPVKEDFEAQAKATITSENVDDEVAQLEAQIQNDK